MKSGRQCGGRPNALCDLMQSTHFRNAADRVQLARRTKVSSLDKLHPDHAFAREIKERFVTSKFPSQGVGLSPMRVSLPGPLPQQPTEQGSGFPFAVNGDLRGRARNAVKPLLQQGLIVYVLVEKEARLIRRLQAKKVHIHIFLLS